MLRFATTLLYVAAFTLLGYWFWFTADGAHAQAVLARRLAALVPPRQGATSARLARAEAQTSGLVGRIEIPRLELSAIIVEGTSSDRLRRGVGHVATTPLPGERGNVVLAAHRDTYFRALRGVRPGDRVIVTTADGTFRYRVESIRVVKPARTDLIAPTHADRLTLVTCYPFHWIGPAPDRFIVRAATERSMWSLTAPGASRSATPGRGSVAIRPWRVRRA